jgi:circadian clock protein KaiB
MTTKSRAQRGNADIDHKGFPRWELRLYVANWEPRSATAIVNLKRLCEQHLSGRYRIQVVDLLKTPRRSQEDQILAIPTVVRRFPLPERRVIGTLSNEKCVAAALELDAESSA